MSTVRSGREPAAITAAEADEQHALPPNGGLAAAVLAAGIGCGLLGVLIPLAEASEGLKETLTFYEPGGSLTGKSTVPVIAWLLAWPALHLLWRRRDVDMRLVMRVTTALVVIGLIGSFPPFFQAFHAGG